MRTRGTVNDDDAGDAKGHHQAPVSACLDQGPGGGARGAQPPVPPASSRGLRATRSGKTTPSTRRSACSGRFRSGWTTSKGPAATLTPSSLALRGAARARAHSQDRAGKDGARDPQGAGWRGGGRRHRRPQAGSGARDVHRRRQHPGGRGDYGQCRRGRPHAVDGVAQFGGPLVHAGDAGPSRRARRRRDPDPWRTAR